MATSMAAASGRFESAKSIEERKEQTRNARAEVLRQAKANFEKEERRKELKRLRGEDTWMLPDVNERLEQFSQEHSVKKKKKNKHLKKAKKEKKKKSKKQKYEKNNESSDSSSSSEDEWVEAVPSQTPDKERAWKMGTAENQNKLFMRMASKFMGKTDGDYYTLDDMFVSKAAERERLGEEEENQRKKAIAEHRSLAAQMEKCLYCFDSSQFPKHLIVAIGVKVYLCLPNVRSLTEGHCLIVPLQHHRAATLLDEDIWEEVQMFRKSLVKMFEDKGLDCIFLETNMGMKKQYHMVYECIPLPKEVGDMAPIYFKKAIMESDEEWSMNKKLIDLSSKDIRKSVPRGLPYFSVDFGLHGGFAHVIEDQHKFPHYFGKEIIGGMLDIEPRLWRKGIRESFEDQRKKALQFAQWWKPYDFTKSKSC
uniref:CWF19-like protein 2 n=1 Tax=Mandrillus leucophaeus TaxID=9568 RepID=A0A2K5Z369_MANLE